MIALTELVRYASNLSPLAPLVLLLSVKKKRTKIIYILTAIIGLSFLSDAISFFMASKRMDTSVFYNTYFVIQFFLLTYLYRQQVKNKKLVYVTTVIFLAFFIINTLFLQPFTVYQSWLRLAGGIICIAYSVGFFRQMMRVDKAEGRWVDNPPIDPFYHYPFWINAAIFYYFSFNLILFAMDNFIFSNLSMEEIKVFLGFHNFNNIIKNFLFAIAIIVFKNKNKSPLL